MTSRAAALIILVAFVVAPAFAFLGGLMAVRPAAALVGWYLGTAGPGPSPAAGRVLGAAAACVVVAAVVRSAGRGSRA